MHSAFRRRRAHGGSHARRNAPNHGVVERSFGDLERACPETLGRLLRGRGVNRRCSFLRRAGERSRLYPAAVSKHPESTSAWTAAVSLNSNCFVKGLRKACFYCVFLTLSFVLCVSAMSSRFGSRLVNASQHYEPPCRFARAKERSMWRFLVLADAQFLAMPYACWVNRVFVC